MSPIVSCLGLAFSPRDRTCVSCCVNTEFLLPVAKHIQDQPLDLSFSDARIRDLCCSKSALVRAFGDELARKIICRLAVLAAAPSLADVPMGPPVGLMRLATRGNLSVAVGADHHIFFQTIPVEAAQDTDFSLISKLLIIGPVPVRAAKARQS